MASRPNHASTTALLLLMANVSGIASSSPRIGKRVRESRDITRLSIALKQMANSTFAKLAMCPVFALGDSVTYLSKGHILKFNCTSLKYMPRHLQMTRSSSRQGLMR